MLNNIAQQVQECESYLPPLTKRPDFDAFWAQTLHQAQGVALRPSLERVSYPSRFVEVYEISYNGFDDTRIYGWLILPVFTGAKRFPCLIHYHGFNGSRGTPADFMHWAAMGLAVLSVDCRDQGGITGNAAAYTGSGLVGNVVTKGILHKNEYYYRAVYMDCLKAIDFAAGQSVIDAAKIILRGTSQGGALGMAVAALDARPCMALVNVPSNSNLEARVEGRHGSYTAVNDYLRRYPDKLDAAYETLSYFDTMNMADKISCPVFASVALADPVCPAKLYYASYNRILAEKQIAVYPFNEHDGAAHVHLERELAFVQSSGILE